MQLLIQLLSLKMKFIFSVFIPAILFLIPAVSIAQNVKMHEYQFQLEPLFKYGKILKHTSNFKPAVIQNSFSSEINLTWQSRGAKDWQRMLNDPAWGLAAGYTYFGNKDILGEAYYLIPNIQFRLFEHKKIQLWLKGGVGLTWLTKHYDVLLNPSNNVIASSINNSSTAALRLKYKAGSKTMLVIGTSITHSSTGDVRLPNLGINIPTFDLGIQYSFAALNKVVFAPDSLNTKKRKSIVFTMRGGVGLYEVFIPDGPIFPILINETSVGKYFGGWNIFSFGVETFFSLANFHFLQEQNIGVNYKMQSLVIAPFIQDEMDWGQVSFTMLMAYQIKKTQLSGTNMYQKLGVNRTIYSFGQHKWRKIKAGVFLTTHWANADYVSMLLSLQL